MGGTFSSQRTRPESAGTFGDRWSNTERVLFANAPLLTIHVMIALIVFITFLWNRVMNNKCRCRKQNGSFLFYGCWVAVWLLAVRWRCWPNANGQVTCCAAKLKVKFKDVQFSWSDWQPVAAVQRTNTTEIVFSNGLFYIQ